MIDGPVLYPHSCRKLERDRSRYWSIWVPFWVHPLNPVTLLGALCSCLRASLFKIPSRRKQSHLFLSYSLSFTVRNKIILRSSSLRELREKSFLLELQVIFLGGSKATVTITSEGVFIKFAVAPSLLNWPVSPPLRWTPPCPPTHSLLCTRQDLLYNSASPFN